jgi:hypothetical protein
MTFSTDDLEPKTKTTRPSSSDPAEVTPADLAEAAAWVRRNARPRDRALWDAETQEPKR